MHDVLCARKCGNPSEQRMLKFLPRENERPPTCLHQVHQTRALHIAQGEMSGPFFLLSVPECDVQSMRSVNVYNQKSGALRRKSRGSKSSLNSSYLLIL